MHAACMRTPGSAAAAAGGVAGGDTDTGAWPRLPREQRGGAAGRQGLRVGALPRVQGRREPRAMPAPLLTGWVLRTHRGLRGGGVDCGAVAARQERESPCTSSAGEGGAGGMPTHPACDDTECASRRPDPPHCAPANGTSPRRVRVLVGIPTIHRATNGFAYLHQVVARLGEASAANSSAPEATPPHHARLAPVLEPVVFLSKHVAPTCRGGMRHAHDERRFDAQAAALKAALHPVPVTVLETPDVARAGFEAPPGIWRPITAAERQHNADLSALLSALANECSNRRDHVRRGDDACVDDNWVLLLEDDFEPCPGFLGEVAAVLHHRCVRRKDAMGVRIGTGGAGLLLQCRDMATVARAFEELADQGHADYLLSWLLTYQPWPAADESDADVEARSGEASAEEQGRAVASTLAPTRSSPMDEARPTSGLHWQRRPFLAYRRTLLNHIGHQSSKGYSYSSNHPTPTCGQSMSKSDGILLEERFDTQCKAFSPCSPPAEYPYAADRFARAPGESASSGTGKGAWRVNWCVGRAA